jgi:hypothetical protein
MKKSHEVRIGMSVYWVTTTTDDDGCAWASANLSGRVAGDRFDAVAAARAALRALPS